MSYLVFRFSCGHVGRDNEAHKAKAHGFIRVAEIRNAPVIDVRKNCPECSK